jgi:hypothetical protein
MCVIGLDVAEYFYLYLADISGYVIALPVYD